MPRALKVYRTPIGFHDAYVAAPTKKAAMEAWGTDKNLFARGEAELVTDPALTAEPLAKPGEVVKRLRGSAAEQIAALGPDKPRAPKQAKQQDRQPKAKPAPPPKPKPSRAPLEAAEEEVKRAEERQREELRVQAEREAALARERRALEKAQADELARLERKRAKEAIAYEEALRRWRG